MSKKSIWIIDDDAIYQIIINKLIQKAGAFSSHLSFQNGKDALINLKNLIQDDPKFIPDIILLDINMPVMDGWEFMEEVEKIKSKFTKEINIFIVSSSIAIEDKEKSKNFIDITGYISKPVSVNDLLAIVSFQE